MSSQTKINTKGNVISALNSLKRYSESEIGKAFENVMSLRNTITLDKQTEYVKHIIDYLTSFNLRDASGSLLARIPLRTMLREIILCYNDNVISNQDVRVWLGYCLAAKGNSETLLKEMASLNESEQGIFFKLSSLIASIHERS